MPMIDHPFNEGNECITIEHVAIHNLYVIVCVGLKQLHTFYKQTSTVPVLDEYEQDPAKVWQLLRNLNMAYVMEETIALHVTATNCNLDIIPSSMFLPIDMAYIFSRNISAHVLKRFNIAMTRVQMPRTKVYEMYLEKARVEHEQHCYKEEQKSRIPLSRVYGVFGIIVIGHVCAVCAHWGEYAYSKYQRK
jgi:hypothetical protein